MYFIYELIILILFIIYLPFFLFKMMKGKYREGFWQRLGFLPQEIKNLFQEGPVIWVHAVSVGETAAASPVVSEIKERFPEHKIIFSTVTDTGQGMARKIIEEADGFIYFPLDFSPVIKRVLKVIQPELVIIMETELWPNFIRLAEQSGVRVMLANGRISDRSARRYHYLGPLMRDMLSRLDVMAMQSAQDVEYILDLGADEEKVINTGNTKFDQTFARPDPGIRERIYQEYKIDPDQPVMVIGSTHPDEEEQLIPVFQRLKAEFPDLVMLLAPRHIRRSDEIETAYRQAGIGIIRRTTVEKRRPEEEPVILVDTIGELAQLYSIADLVFVGGSLVPNGGHNILEPAAHGKVVFFGPHMFNFKDNTRLLLEKGVGVQVEDVEELINKMLYFLKNPGELHDREDKAEKMMDENRGAAARTADLAEGLIGVKRNG